MLFLMIFVIFGTIIINSASSQNVNICQGFQATIIGTEENDVLTGTKGDDVIVGGGGNDEIDGSGGNDIICGNDGNDVLKGGSGNDVLVGGDGNDRVNGGRGNDELIGGPGSDYLDGGIGTDKCDFVKNVDLKKISCEEEDDSSQYTDVKIIPEEEIEVEGFVGGMRDDFFTLHLEGQFALDFDQDIITIFYNEDTEFQGFNVLTGELLGQLVKVDATFIDGQFFATSIFLEGVEEEIDEVEEEEEIGLKGSLIEVRESYFKLQVGEDILTILTDEKTEFLGFENLIDPLGRTVVIRAESVDGELLAKEIGLDEGEGATEMLEKSIKEIIEGSIKAAIEESIGEIVEEPIEELVVKPPEKKLATTKIIEFEQTTIIELENTGLSEIGSLRIWLDEDIAFLSYKTEEGWAGKGNSQSIVFIGSEPIKPAESVKFGVITDKPNPSINWKALDKNEEEVEYGNTLDFELNGTSTKVSKEKTPKPERVILSNSTFRLIPENPRVDSTIRVFGENFAPNEKLSYSVENKFTKSFETDSNGQFIFTTKVPDLEKRFIEFIIADKLGYTKTLNLRIAQSADPMIDDAPLTLVGLAPVFQRGDVLLLSGTGIQGSGVTISIEDPEGKILTSNVASINSEGNWSFATIVSINDPFGEYTATVTDGRETIVETWKVESSQKLQVVPAMIRFEPGEALSFNGTATPEETLEIIINNPLGLEIYSNILKPNDLGFFEIQVPTEKSILLGTYVLHAYQGEFSDTVLVGVGVRPTSPLLVSIDKVNYRTGEDTFIVIDGLASSTLLFQILDASGNPKISDTIFLGYNGKKEMVIDLEGYTSGVYTMVISRGQEQFSQVFTIGLREGVDPIEINLTQDFYFRGESITIFANAGPSVILTITMIDPFGEIFKVEETFTDREGTMQEISFRVPADARIGDWTIQANSGPNITTKEFSVTEDRKEGLSITEITFEHSYQGELVTITGFGAKLTQGITIEITSSDEEVIDTLWFFSTKTGKFSTHWIIPPDLPPGFYTITASDYSGSDSVTIEIG